ncbi:Protein farnesyltransferase subunit beta [Psilocybe cubensis]|uniref:Protein farnesyltransferase subunit beta n=2 Tax=Psilocybe cubensis TaxID=181762 RepID=A0ACB8GHA9_PSICU|nr:Protein farnesyltransferase subunit beta [Psilocybe cubensis]KAH9474984.1 Protein farnesyltransferase subunit beta [Psilocybe cubensis]
MLPPKTTNDGFPTPTSLSQSETEEMLIKHIPDDTSQKKPTLDKKMHMSFLVRNLVQGFPERYISQDASQPWLLFWTVQAFSVLQVGLDPGNKQRIIDKVLAWQHPDGGFGGGPGQAAHLLPTYASVCILAIVGRPGPGGGWDQIDREKMYKFFMSLKLKDGSFLVAHHSEVDVRGIYCLLMVATFLDLLTPELVEGTASFVASCQTYEGGFASSSHPSYSLSGDVLPPPAARPPLGEAHGGYTFCALASWVLLQPYLELSQEKPTIDVSNLLRWLVHMQGTFIELGGFKGRTNKLVDGCYSWWCGGSFALLEALGVGGIQNANSDEVPIDSGTGDGVWDDVDEGLYNRMALQEYIIYAGQHPTGGLRDKPPKNADAYHTLYCLSGLSSAQHHVFPSHLRKKQFLDSWKSSDSTKDELRKRSFGSILSWIEEEGASHILGGTENRLNATHPLTNLTITHTEAITAHFYEQDVPAKQRSAPTPTRAAAATA